MTINRVERHQKQLQAILSLILILFLIAVIPSRGQGEVISIETRHSQLLKTQQPIIRASVANPDVADVKVLTPHQVLIIANTKRAGSTNLILWFEGEQIKNYDIHIHRVIPRATLTAIENRIADIAPDVKVAVLEGGTGPDEASIILKGEVSSQATLNQILTVAKSFGIPYFNLIRLTGSQQVQLKVLIAEISKSGLRQMGVNFAHMGEQLSVGILKGAEGSGPVDFSNDGTTLEANYTGNTPFATAFQISMNAPTQDWMGILSLLKTQGLARSLATPTLVTMNGQQATFHAGGEFPVPVPGKEGNVSIDYKEYGVMLEFTPYIIDQDTITLKVSPEVSFLNYSVQVSSGGATVPGLSKRRATTTLQLKSGQTFAMAGLLQEDYHQTDHKIPFFGDIPFIGGLFTAKEHSIQERELVVMVTPTIVQAMAPEQVPPLPGNHLQTRTSDSDFFIKNKLENMGPPQPASSEFRGNTGFIK